MDLQFEDKHHTLLVKAIAEQLQCSPSAIVDFELNVCDTQAGVIGGMHTVSPSTVRHAPRPQLEYRLHRCLQALTMCIAHTQVHRSTW